MRRKSVFWVTQSILRLYYDVFANILIYTFTKYFPEYTSVTCIFGVFCNWEDRSTQRKLPDLYLEVGFELF